MEQDDNKYFHAENITKNLVTTIIGVLIMVSSAATYVVSWYVDLPRVNPTHLAIAFVAGFALLFMRNNLISYIDIFTKKKIG